MFLISMYFYDFRTYKILMTLPCLWLEMPSMLQKSHPERGQNYKSMTLWRKNQIILIPFKILLTSHAKKFNDCQKWKILKLIWFSVVAFLFPRHPSHIFLISFLIIPTLMPKDRFCNTILFSTSFCPNNWT